MQLYYFILHDSVFQDNFKLIVLLDILDIHCGGKQDYKANDTGSFPWVAK